MKKKPNPKPTINDQCFISSTPYAELHEVFFGNPNARISQDYKMQLRLSSYWHRDQVNGIHHNVAFRKIVQHYFYFKFLEWYPDEDWKEVFNNTKNPVLFCDELEEYAAQLPEGVTLDKLKQIQYLTKGDM